MGAYLIYAIDDSAETGAEIEEGEDEDVETGDDEDYVSPPPPPAAASPPDWDGYAG